MIATQDVLHQPSHSNSNSPELGLLLLIMIKFLIFNTLNIYKDKI